MRLVLVALVALASFAVRAQGAGPLPPPPYRPGFPAGGQWAGQTTPQDGVQQSYGGCYGCSYVGDYRPNPGPPRPAPPLRLQGQWRNGWWYY
jgi:hypothetical protein